MGDFRHSGGRRFGSNHGGGFDRRDGGRDRGPVTMHQAVCSQCGKPCEVPFEPTSGKPVYCNECFATKRDSEGGRSDSRFAPKSFSSYKSPASTSFGGNADRGNSEDLKKQLELLNGKMDQLIKVVESLSRPKPLVVEPKEPKAEKTVKTTPIVKAKKTVKAVSKKAKAK